jgi:hypothetical protein
MMTNHFLVTSMILILVHRRVVPPFNFTNVHICFSSTKGPWS